MGETMKVAVFGLGYVGTVTAAVLASNGHEVIGVDVDSTKVATVANGRSPVVEPGLEVLVADAVAAGKLTATGEVGRALEGADLSLLCVGTPSSPQGSTDLTYLHRAIADITAALRAQSGGHDRRHALVVRSTVPPGTLAQSVGPMVEEGTTGCAVSVGIGMCPEFLREGTAIADFYETPLTVVGTEDEGVARTMTELFSFLDQPIQVVPSSVAEALKIACNAFHATKISFANELGRLFRQLGVDSRAVMDLFCQDTKLNISEAYLSPGFAFGGSCLPKDLRSLLYVARMNCLDLPLLSGTLATNALSVSEVVSRVIASDARTVAVLGLSFKMDSDDLRESPFVDLAETLIGKGFEVRIFDPIVDSDSLVGANRQYVDAKLPHLGRAITNDPAEALRGADVALVSSSHSCVLGALLEDPPTTIIDLCGRLGASVEALPGYQGVAW
jgi:GDP-mannose 6-dehydrogenase